MLSVLHISAADNAGGSGRSAYRIHTGLRASGHRSRMLVNYRVTDDPDVAYIWRSLGWRAADWIARSITERLSLQYLFYPSSFALAWHPWFREADVLQLYNTHGGFFSHPALTVLSRSKPVVWRLSDMWPMTGHCAYSYDCDRWKTGCGACPIVGDAPALLTDRTALLWKVKRAVYERSRVVLVAPSRWMAARAAESPLLGRFPVRIIPNGLDPEVFRPIPKPSARDMFGIAPSEHVLLFAAVDVDAERKGGRQLQDAIERLASTAGPSFRLLVVGAGAAKWQNRVRIPVTAVPALSDDRLLAAMYSAADVFVMPTLAENLPNAVLESMACGTPTVAFDIGGVPDAVRDGETGWLAKTGDAEDLARAIAAAFGDDERRAAMGRLCRDVVEAEYTATLQTRRFEHLYQELLDGRAAGAPLPLIRAGVA